MSLVLASLIFVLAILVVAASRRWLIFELTAISKLVTGHSRPGTLLYAVLTFPGTVLHELSHWLVAELLRVPTGEITLVPRSEDQRETHLGSVMTGRTDSVRGFLIGLAPFVTGLLALALLNHALLILWGSAPWWQVGLVLYGQIVVAGSMLISRADRRYWPIVIILLAVAVVVAQALEVSISSITLDFIARELTSLDLVLGLAIGLNLILLGALFGVRYLLQKLLGKKVVARSNL